VRIFDETLFEMKNKSGLNFLLGAAVGAFITWLFTSKQGKELRDKAQETISDLTDEIKQKVAALQDDKTAGKE
jgi:gas vesicle protein